jgi:hypothetical protein
MHTFAEHYPAIIIMARLAFLAFWSRILLRSGS